MTSRFYAADLAAYNSGILHGIWVDATSDADEMQEQIAAMLRASPCPNVTVEHPETNETVPSAEEWVVHDYDDAAKLISHMGETSDLKAIAEAAEAFEEISDDYHETILPFLLDWVRDRVTEPHAWKAALDDAFAGEWNDPEDYAADLAEQCGYLENLPDALQNYIDFRAMARDMALGGEMDFICTSTGQHLQNYDNMRGRECIALRNL